MILRKAWCQWIFGNAYSSNLVLKQWRLFHCFNMFGINNLSDETELVHKFLSLHLWLRIGMFIHVIYWIGNHRSALVVSILSYIFNNQSLIHGIFEIAGVRNISISVSCRFEDRKVLIGELPAFLLFALACIHEDLSRFLGHSFALLCDVLFSLLFLNPCRF